MSYLVTRTDELGSRMKKCLILKSYERKEEEKKVLFIYTKERSLDPLLLRVLTTSLYRFSLLSTYFI